MGWRKSKRDAIYRLSMLATFSRYIDQQQGPTDWDSTLGVIYYHKAYTSISLSFLFTIYNNNLNKIE